MPDRSRRIAPTPRFALALVLCLGGAAASSLAPSTAWAAGAAPGQATAAQRRDAQTHYDKARKAYLAGNYGPAIEEFRASFDVVASPNTSLYLARALRENGQAGDAYAEFGRTIDSASSDARYAKTAQIATTERQALESQLAFVTVHVAHATADTKLEVAGHDVPAGADGAPPQSPIPVAPGNVSVTVTKPGHDPVTKTVTVAAGAKDEVSIDADGNAVASGPPPAAPPPAAPSRAPLRTYAYVAGGVGVVGILTFVVAGIMANSTYGDLQDKCGSSPCPASLGDEISRGKTQQTIANVGLVIGVVGAAAGVTLFVLSNKQKDGEAAAPATAFVAGPSFTGVRGAF